MDETWFAIGNVNTDGCLAFKELGIAMCRILTIPHSSAHCERVFRVLGKTGQNKGHIWGMTPSNLY